LSEILKFSSSDIRDWLGRETSSIFTPVHTKVQRLIDEMHRTLENLSDVSKTLLENSGKEIEKRNMKTYRRARALNKLARLFLDRTRGVKVPEKISYDSAIEFIGEIQKAFLVIEVDIRNWFPRISPYFIMDRRKFLAVFEKAKESLKELNNFLTKEYVKTKTLEETFEVINRLQSLEEQLTDLKEQKKKVEAKETSLEGEMAETQQKMADLKNKDIMRQLREIGMEIKTLRVELKRNLRHLRKPFIKFQALTLHGGGSGLTPEEFNKLNKFVENPFEAFSSEREGYPLLKQILQKLDRSISEGKLKLKSDRKRKAEQDMDNILNKSSLATLHKKSVEAITQRKYLSTLKEVTETKSDLLKLQERLENLEGKMESVKSEESAIERAYNETSEKIRNHKNQIEKNIFSFMSKKVHIE